MTIARFDATQPHIPETSLLLHGWNILPSTLPSIASISPTERLNDALLKQVESSWTAYTKRCCAIWLAVASSSGIAFGASDPLLQMPGTNSDPLVRALVYLSILRFFAAIPSAIVLRHYFNKPGFKSPHFALVWYQSVKEDHQSGFYMPWAILALPAVFFCWGIIFLIVALFTALWRTGLSPDPLAGEDADPLTLMLSRTILSTLSVIDVACGVWLVKLLKTFNKRTQAKFVVMHPQVN